MVNTGLYEITIRQCSTEICLITRSQWEAFYFWQKSSTSKSSAVKDSKICFVLVCLFTAMPDCPCCNEVRSGQISTKCYWNREIVNTILRLNVSILSHPIHLIILRSQNFLCIKAGFTQAFIDTKFLKSFTTC